MVGFLLIVGFPLLLGLGFGSLYMVTYATGRDASILDRAGFVLYPLLLAIPWGVCAVTAGREGALADVGLRWPAIAGLPTLAAAAIGVLAGVVVGVLLFYNELLVSSLLQRWSRSQRAVNRLMEGATESFAEQNQQVSHLWTLGLSVLIVAGEEFLWRGYLMRFLGERFGLSLFWIVLLSSLSFGLNHYYFGLRNVLLKMFAGAVWALLFLATGSLLVPWVSHYTFEVLVWQRIQR